MSSLEKLKAEAVKLRKNIDAVYEAGKQAEYDRFWDEFQQNGARTDYGFALRYGWTDVIFKPKYDFIMTTCNSMFQYSGIVNLREILQDCGVVFDTSNCTMMVQMFQGADCKTIPTLDIRKSTNSHYMFGSGSSVEEIEKLIISETTDLGGTTMFGNAKQLVKMNIEGTIGQNFNVQSSPLNLESAKSVIRALKNFAGTDQEYTCTVTFSSTTKAYLEAEGATSPNGNTWLDYIDDIGWSCP